MNVAGSARGSVRDSSIMTKTFGSMHPADDMIYRIVLGMNRAIPLQESVKYVESITAVHPIWTGTPSNLSSD